MFIIEAVQETVKKVRAQFANMLTFSNLSCGVLSLFASMEGLYQASFLFIVMAALFDRFDGYFARKLGTESEFGKQLDSLCDLVSFGLAPMILLYSTVLHEYAFSGALLAVFYIGCGAFRLARFNTMKSNGYFVGLPITAAGCLAMISYLALPVTPSYVYVLLTLLLGVLMISPFKLKKI